MVRPLLAGGCLALAGLVASPALAQPQNLAIPPGILDLTRQLSDNTIRFCINTASVLSGLDRGLAETIADALLIEAEFYEVNSPFAVPPYDFRIPFPERELFIIFNNNCDAFMGVRLSAGNMPEWMSISRPYFSTRAVIASTDPAITSWADIPAGAQVSSRMAAPGDVNFTAFLRTLPENERPSRVPYPDYGLVLDRLRDGSVQAAFVWEPALWFASDGDPEAIGVTSVFAPPFTVPPIGFGVAFMAEDTFTRELIDAAIATLDASGALDALIAEHVPMP